MVHRLNLNQAMIKAAKTVIKVATFLYKYLQLHISYYINFFNILRTSFHKFCVLLVFKNYKNGAIRICKNT